MTEALVLIDLIPHVDKQAVIARIKGIPNVVWADLVFGSSDAGALVQAPDRGSFTKTIFEINDLPEVEGTDTRIGVGG
jgi:hypothetical protein